MRIPNLLVAGLLLAGFMHSGVALSQQSGPPYSAAIGAQAVKVVLRGYRLIKDTKTLKALPTSGDWSIGKTTPPACPATQQICVEVFYRVPSVSAECRWIVLMNADGSDVKFLDESDDTERYFLRRFSSGEAATVVKNTVQPVYPAIANAAHVRGLVTLDVVIDKTGKYQEVTVVQGPEMLKQTSKDAASKCDFSRLMIGSRPMSYEVQIVYSF